jgi:hypothetical protein
MIFCFVRKLSKYPCHMLGIEDLDSVMVAMNNAQQSHVIVD